MKKLGTRVFAAALVVWYSLSIIGFGIHTCSDSNRSFLTSFISGISCEDVHSAERCGKSCCGETSHKHMCRCCCDHSGDIVKDIASEPASSDGQTFSQRGCCSDDYQQIIITGSGQNSGSEHSLSPLCVGYCAYIYACALGSSIYSKGIRASAIYYHGLSISKLRPLLSIWRI